MNSNDRDSDGDHPLTVDAIDYMVEVSGRDDLIRVFDCTGQMVASAEHDGMDGALHANFFDAEDGHIRDYDARQVDLYEKPWREVATWLCAVHPNV